MITDKDYVSDAINSREKPIMDLTNTLVGYSPFTSFKRRYSKNKDYSSEIIAKQIEKFHGEGQHEKALPLQYLLTQRGVQSRLYKDVKDSDVKDIMARSGDLSRDYLSQSIATAGTFTGVAGIDTLRDYIANSSKLPGATATTSNINMSNYAPWRGFRDMGDPYTLSKRLVEQDVHGKLNYGFRLAGRNFNGNLYDSFIKHFGSDVGDSLSSGLSNKGRFIRRLIGYGWAAPRSALYASPLLLKSVTGKLKGNDENSARHKAFSWIENHPVETMATTMAPGLLASTIRDGATVHRLWGSRSRGTALLQAGLSTLRGGLAASVPLGFVSLKQKYDNAKKDQKDFATTFKKEV